MKELVEVIKLIVNPENYRFNPVENQDQAIDLMIREKGEEILELARHIERFGLDVAKDIRVLKMKEYYLVLDGNRRVTAVKCLHNPSLVKNEKLRKDFQDLQVSFLKHPIDEISCFVYPNEKAASEWIRLDHTGKNEGVGQDPWGAPARDRFDLKFGGKLSPAMQALDILNQDGFKVDPKALKISTVNRILSNPLARKILGIDVKNGELLIVDDEAKSKSRLKKLYEKIANDDVTVDLVYTKDKIKIFMEELFGKELSSEKSSKVEKVTQEKIKIFVITAFAGLDDVFKTIKETTESLLDNVEVSKVQASGAKLTLDQKIEKALDSSDFLIAVLSMGEKERLVYDTIKQVKNPQKILEQSFPINQNVLLELGYGLKSVKGRGKEKDIFLVVDATTEPNLPSLKDFCSGRFFDIRNRDQIFYKDLKELGEELTKAIKRSDCLVKYLKK